MSIPIDVFVTKILVVSINSKLEICLYEEFM